MDCSSPSYPTQFCKGALVSRDYEGAVLPTTPIVLPTVHSLSFAAPLPMCRRVANGHLAAPLAFADECDQNWARNRANDVQALGAASKICVVSIRHWPPERGHDSRWIVNLILAANSTGNCRKSR